MFPPVSASPFQPGQQVDRYEIIGRLGAGGMATVYRVRHTELGTEHALKVVDSIQQDAAQRLRREGRALGTLDHPGIVRVTDLIEVDDMPALVMEFVDGPTLAELLRDGPIAKQYLDDLVGQLLHAVGAAHDKGFVHRDLKPANILLSAKPNGGWHLRVADFGLVKAMHPSHANTMKTREGLIIGTPAYMAPEQANGNFEIGPGTDIWALGAVLFEMVTGTRAFEGRDPMMVLGRVSLGKYDHERLIGIPNGQVLAIRSSLRLRPDERASSCGELLNIWQGTMAPSANATGAAQMPPPRADSPPSRVPKLRRRLVIPLFICLSLLGWILMWKFAPYLKPKPPQGAVHQQNLAVLAFHDADFTNAIRHANTLLDDSPSDTEATLVLALASRYERDQGEYEAILVNFTPPAHDSAEVSALKILKLSVSDNPNSLPEQVKLHEQKYFGHALSHIAFSGLDLEDKARHVEVALAAVPDSAAAHYAGIFAVVSETDVQRYVKKGLEKRPRNPTLLAQAAYSAISLNRPDDARAYIVRLTKARPGDQETLHLQLMMAIHDRDFEQRTVTLDAIRALGPNRLAKAATLSGYACILGQSNWAHELFLTAKDRAMVESTLQNSTFLNPQLQVCAGLYLRADFMRDYANRLRVLAAAPEVEPATQQRLQVERLHLESWALMLEGKIDEAQAMVVRLTALGEPTELQTIGINSRIPGQHDVFEPSQEACLEMYVAADANRRVGHVDAARTQFLWMLNDEQNCAPIAAGLRGLAAAHLAEMALERNEVKSARKHAESTLEMLEKGDEDLLPIVMARKVLSQL
jgi:serine/threonine protein kinase